MDCQIHFSCVRSGAEDATGAAALVATLAAVASASVTAAAAAAAKQKCVIERAVCKKGFLQISITNKSSLSNLDGLVVCL
jgi:uncharacterized membrane protein